MASLQVKTHKRLNQNQDKGNLFSVMLKPAQVCVTPIRLMC